MNGPESLGRLAMGLGVLLLLLGLVLRYGGRILPLGRLPGDILVRRGSFTFFFPLMTMLVVSLVLSFLFNFFLRR